MKTITTTEIARRNRTIADGSRSDRAENRFKCFIPVGKLHIPSEIVNSHAFWALTLNCDQAMTRPNQPSLDGANQHVEAHRDDGGPGNGLQCSRPTLEVRQPRTDRYPQHPPAKYGSRGNQTDGECYSE